MNTYLVITAYMVDGKPYHFPYTVRALNTGEAIEAALEVFVNRTGQETDTLFSFKVEKM